LHPDDKERSLAEWMGCVRSGEAYESEYRMRDYQGQYRWFRARAVPLRDPNGSIVKWYGTCSDIHDSKLLEQSIRDSAIQLERLVDDRTAALRRLSGRLLTMQDDERRRIARELHDGLGQELAAAKMMMDGIVEKNSAQSNRRAATEASETIDRAIKQVRSLSHLLHPPLLDEVGLLSALQWYLDGLTKRSGIETSLDVQPPEFPRLTVELETAIFRIIQEALTNVYRHSGAQKAWVTLMQHEKCVVVKIQDDGKGIEHPIAELHPGSIGIGIGGMNQRAKEFGGKLRLLNADPGTVVQVEIPSLSPQPQKTHVMA